MSKEIAVKEDSFIVEMPDNAPALGFDPNLESFNWREVYPSNYWSIDELEERKQQLGGWPVLTPARVVIRPVYDPAEYEGKEPPASELAPKLVIEFAEAAPALVLNKSRCDMVTKMTGTPNPARWGGLLPPLILSVGVYNKRAQIVIEAVPQENGRKRGKGSAVDVDKANEELFG